MTDTSMEDAAAKRRAKHTHVDKSMEEAIVNMSPEELAEYFKGLKENGASDEDIASLRATAAQSLATQGGGKASEFLQRINDKKAAADAADPPEEPPVIEPPAEAPKPEEPKAEGEKPKRRKRRTKEEMEAAREADAKKKAGKDAETQPPATEPAPAGETLDQVSERIHGDEEPAPEPANTMLPDMDSEPEIVMNPDDEEEEAARKQRNQDRMDAFSGKKKDEEDDDDEEGITLLIPDKGNLFLCEPVADGYEDVGNMVSGPWKDMKELEAAAERYIADNEDGNVEDLFVVEVTKKATFEKKIVLTFA